MMTLLQYSIFLLLLAPFLQHLKFPLHYYCTWYTWYIRENRYTGIFDIPGVLVLSGVPNISYDVYHVYYVYFVYLVYKVDKVYYVYLVYPVYDVSAVSIEIKVL